MIIITLPMPSYVCAADVGARAQIEAGPTPDSSVIVIQPIDQARLGDHYTQAHMTKAGDVA